MRKLAASGIATLVILGGAAVSQSTASAAPASSQAASSCASVTREAKTFLRHHGVATKTNNTRVIKERLARWQHNHGPSPKASELMNKLNFC